MSLLSVQHINSGYDNKQVLFDVSLEVEEGETVLLIGSNGSGKSTLFKTIYGVLPLWKAKNGSIGKVFYDGVDITDVPSHCLIKRGLMYMPQDKELFEDMTVKDNLNLSVLHLNDRKESKKRINEVFEKLGVINSKRKQLVTELSGGERKLLSLGMVLMNKPKLLLYDEPLAGLSGNNSKAVLQWLKIIKENGTALVLIEHRIKELMEIADKVVGLKLGIRNEVSLESIGRIKAFMI